MNIASLIGGQGSIIGKTFARMGIAEEEIAAAKRRQPRKAKLIQQAFKWLVPSQLLQDKTDLLYREHCCELVSRIASGKDPVPLTRAEVLAALSEASLIAPLGQRSAALMGKLFVELKLGTIEQTPEPWKGSSDQLLAEMQRTAKLSNPRRGIS